MKKVDTSNIILGTRRMGFNKAVLDHLQEAFTDLISDMMIGILANASGVTIIRGIVNSGSLPTYTITAGTVFYNGEMFEVDAFSGTATGADVAVLTLETTYRAGDPIKYSDNNEFNTNAIRKLKWGFGLTGTGIVDFSALQVNLKTTVAGKLSSAAGAVLTANLADDSVTNDKANSTIFRGALYSPASTDCDTFEVGSIQVVTGASSNAPDATSGHHFLIITAKGDLNGSIYQVAHQVLGTGKGTIFSRYQAPLSAYGAWTSDNT